MQTKEAALAKMAKENADKQTSLEAEVAARAVAQEAAKADAVQTKAAALAKMAKEYADKKASLEAEVAAKAAAHASAVQSTVAKHEAARAASLSTTEKRSKTGQSVV